MSRRTAWTIGLAVVLASAATATALWAPWRSFTHEPVEPALSFTQDAAGVHLTVHNRNAHWGLRHQPVRITLFDAREGFAIIRTYGPKGDFHVSETDRRFIQCCEVSLLVPHGDYRFDLWPSRRQVVRIEVVLRGGDGWVRM